MEHEEQFYAELKNTPDVPEDIYPEIAKKIGRRNTVLRSLLVAAACLVLVIGGLSYFQFTSGQSGTIALEASEELQYIENYFSYSDLEPDSTLYTRNGTETSDDLFSIIDYFTGDNIETDIDMYAIVDSDIL